MTKGEALSKLILTATTSRGFSDADGLVAALVALGLLKLDEPKDPQKTFMDMLGGYLSRESTLSLVKQMESRGLKIVEHEHHGAGR